MWFRLLRCWIYLVIWCKCFKQKSILKVSYSKMWLCCFDQDWVLKRTYLLQSCRVWIKTRSFGCKWKVSTTSFFCILDQNVPGCLFKVGSLRGTELVKGKGWSLWQGRWSHLFASVLPTVSRDDQSPGLVKRCELSYCWWSDFSQS